MRAADPQVTFVKGINPSSIHPPVTISQHIALSEAIYLNMIIISIRYIMSSVRSVSPETCRTLRGDPGCLNIKAHPRTRKCLHDISNITITMKRALSYNDGCFTQLMPFHDYDNLRGKDFYP